MIVTISKVVHPILSSIGLEMEDKSSKLASDALASKKSRPHSHLSIPETPGSPTQMAPSPHLGSFHFVVPSSPPFLCIADDIHRTHDPLDTWCPG
jgi:hypothetical protein